MYPHYQENYIEFRFDMSDAAASALVSRAVAMKLTFQTDDDEGNKKTFLLPMISEASIKYVKLATGLLGSEYLGKNFTVTEAELLYDTGVQGWSILERSDALFALQYKNSSTNLTNFTPSNYAGATALADTPANGALLSLNDNSFSLTKLRGVIASSRENDAKLPLAVYNRVTTADVYWRYLYPTRLGVDVGNSTNVSQLSGQYLVPKQVGSYTLNFSNGENTGTLSEMTPTIDKPDFHASSSKIDIDGIKVSGFSTDGGTIYVAAYENREDAEKLAEGHKATGTITIGEGGTPTGTDVALDGLTGETKYYLAFYYIRDGKSILLLDSTSADAAIYEVTTSSKAVINAELLYRNDSYFDKSLVVDYTISRIFDLSMTYDIFANEAAASENGAPILSNNDMLHSSILTAPSTVSYNNEITINLTPSSARSKLKPGTTYYLKITAEESNGTEAGSQVVPFTITAVGNYGALIYVSDAGKDSITFQVTINDPQFSLMGRKGGSENGAALYAVRFTDGDGNVLRTSYDDEVYSASVLRKEFVLSNDKLKNDGITSNNKLKENTAYSLNIYAVPDADHDGTITLNSVSLGWEKFFDKTASALKDCGEKLLGIINSFWNTNTSSTSDTREDQLLIATKQQKTLPESGWILNEDGVYATRYDPTTIRIQFDESVGLLSGENPVFKRIDWSVIGRTTGGTPVNVSGRSVCSKGDLLLQARASDSGYGGYYYNIPADLGQGTYTIVLQFRTTEETAAPNKTITIRSGV